MRENKWRTLSVDKTSRNNTSDPRKTVIVQHYTVAWKSSIDRPDSSFQNSFRTSKRFYPVTGQRMRTVTRKINWTKREENAIGSTLSHTLSLQSIKRVLVNGKSRWPRTTETFPISIPPTRPCRRTVQERLKIIRFTREALHECVRIMQARHHSRVTAAVSLDAIFTSSDE